MYSQIASNKRKSVLLVVLFILLLAALGYLWSKLADDRTYSGVWFALLFSLFFSLISYYRGDKIALWINGAKPITREENRYVWNLVENVCLTAGIPVPKIYLINDPAINAFATGRKPESAALALTTGAVEKLANEELEGVISHEISHIKNYDIRFLLLVATLVGAVAMLADMLLRVGAGFNHRSSNDRSGAGAFLILIAFVFAILAVVIGEIIKLAVSRRREYLADASGALLTRYPEGLAKALEKIAAANQPLKRPAEATASLYFANPFGRRRLLSALFSTHPPVEERIKRLRAMTA